MMFKTLITIGRYLFWIVLIIGIIGFLRLRWISKWREYSVFGNNEPDYKGSGHDGLRMDIDKYYEHEEHRKELERINNSDFPKIIKLNNQ